MGNLKIIKMVSGSKVDVGIGEDSFYPVYEDSVNHIIYYPWPMYSSNGIDITHKAHHRPDCDGDCPINDFDDNGQSACDYAKKGGNCQFFCGYVPEEERKPERMKCQHCGCRFGADPSGSVIECPDCQHVSVPDSFRANEVNTPHGNDIILNYTPHPVEIRYVDKHGNARCARFLTTDLARVREKNIKVPGGRFPCVRKKYCDVDDLPEPKQNTWYIVSLVVFQNSDRRDLLCPDTGPDSVIRDRKGNIVAVRRFMVK